MMQQHRAIKQKYPDAVLLFRVGDFYETFGQDAVICWVSGFDIIYALQDVDFDRSQQLYSIPAWVGKGKALRISELLHVLSAAAVIAAGVYGHFMWLYWIGVLVFVGMLVYQHSIVKPDDLRRVNLAFMTANGIASVVFAIFVITALLIH